LRPVDTTPGPAANLMARRDQLRAEILNLTKLVAAGLAIDAATPEIRNRESEIARIEMQLRLTRPAPPDIERLRDALMQRTAGWKADLRRESAVAGLVLRRLIEPLELWHESPPDPARASSIESGDTTGTDWKDEDRVRWETDAKPDALLDGLAGRTDLVASPTGNVDLYLDLELTGSTRRAA
jgi:hypothetical protein